MHISKKSSIFAHIFETMKNIAFIINPISGTFNKRRIPKLVDKLLDKEQWMPDVVYTEYKGHGTELAKRYAQLGFDAVVAVGGDGTVNEVASGLCGTNTALGIVPVGSGNGFARHLGTPLSATNAIEALNHMTPVACDYGLANDHPFFATCGTGFDAHISEEFQKAGKRGFRTYLEKILTQIFSFQPEEYRIEGEGLNLEGKAFLLTVANCNQWGHDAMIAPKASVQDGKLDLVICSPFPLILAPGLGLALFTKTIDQRMQVTSLKVKELTLHRAEGSSFHLDGDPVDLGSEIHIRVVEDGLKVLVPKKY